MKVSRVLPLLLLWLAFTGPAQAVTFDQWRAAHFSPAEMNDAACSAATADPDADGLCNLLEYALALDPRVADSALGLRLTRQQNAPALNFFRRLDAGDLFYALEVSPDLTHWSLRNTAGQIAGAAGRVTWSDLAPPPPGPHRFLRLRVAEGTPPFIFTDAPALLAATATHPRIGVDLLWSDRANVETGYDLQRLRPGETAWQAFAELPADSMSYRDEAVTGSATYSYRVRALLPGGTATAWSNEAAATLLPDTDGDGLADMDEMALGTDPNNFSTGGSGLPDGWLWQHFLSLFNPAIGDLDSDGDGLTNAQEYAADTDPNDTDSDHDGTPDGSDGHPSDPKRSADIPVRYYGVIDLSASLDNPFSIDTLPYYPLTTFNVIRGTTIAMDDEGRVAFAGFSTAGPVSSAPGQTVLRSVVWQNGAITADRTTPFGNDPSDPSVEHAIFPVGINITGDVFGIAGVTIWNYDDLYTDHETFSFTSGNYYESNYEETGATDPTVIRTTPAFVGPSGTIFGTESWHEEATGEHFRPFFGAKKFTDGITGYPFAASPADKLVWKAYNSLNDSSKLHIWDPATDTNETLPTNGQPLAISDQKQVVGKLWQYDAEGYNQGFFYENGQLKAFQDLIPAKFKKQIRSAIPYLITNADSTANRPTIYFTAESYEGSPKPDWVSGEFALELAASAAEESALYATPAPPGKTFKGNVVNKEKVQAGTSAATPAPGSPAATPMPALRIPCEFVPRTDHPLGAINFGFDPPIKGDSARSTGDGSKKDEELQEFWASVTKTGATDDPGYDPHINTSVAVQFSSADVAKDYKLVVPPAFSSVLTVAPTELTAKNTPITLTGAAGGGSLLQQVDARVEVQHKVSGQVIQTLKVKVLPLITVDLGIFRVEDSVDLSADHAKNSQLDPALPDNAAIIRDLNRFFIQCGVHFTLNSGSHNYIAANPLRFDVGQPNGSLDSAKESDPELTYLKGESQIKTGKLNLVILHRLTAKGPESSTAGFCPVSDTDPSIINGNQVFVFSSYFESLASGDRTRAFAGFKQVCAHELGHALGLSTRQNFEPKSGTHNRRWTRNHDLGLFPLEVDLQGNPKEGPPEEGLMYPEASHERRWIRHEDWFKANTKAQDFR